MTEVSKPSPRRRPVLRFLRKRLDGWLLPAADVRAWLGEAREYYKQRLRSDG